jgi:hypothetical protein
MLKGKRENEVFMEPMANANTQGKEHEERSG